jgi:hypothetical protein
MGNLAVERLRRSRRRRKWLTAALALAAISAWFSITGMTSVFVGAFWPVIGMGIALEAGKLSAVAWLGHHHGTASPRLRFGLVALVGILMGLNAIGAYGFRPVRYLATLLGATDEAVLRCFILMVALLLDPAAVLLLLAATRKR